MEGRRQKSILIDVCKHPHRSAVAHPQQVEVVRVRAVFAQQRNGVQAGPIVLQLPLEPTVFSGKIKSQYRLALPL